MTNFPVTSSTLSALHIGHFLRENYDIGQDVSCKLIITGINDTYEVITATEKFVFRVYSLDWRSKTEIEEEIKLLNQLKENTIAVSYAIADKSNNYIQSFDAPEGERFGVMFTFALGEKQHIIYADSHFRIGQLVARFHTVSHNQKIERITYTPDVLLVDSLDKISVFLSSESEEMGFMRSTQKYLLKTLQLIDQSQLRMGIVHLDIWYDNLNISAENEVTIFDFDFCGNGWLCLDIAYYIMQLHNIEKYDSSAYQSKIDSFIRGYESITPICDEEKRLIPILGVSLYYFYLGVQCQRYDNWSNTFLSENYLKRFINGIVKRYFDMYKDYA